MAPQNHVVSSEDMEKVCFLLSAKKHTATSENDWWNYDALLEAIMEDRQVVIEMLLDKGSRAIKKGHELQVLIGKMDWSSVAELLLYLGARSSDSNSNGDTALHLAFVNGAAERAVNMLLSNYLEETTENGENDDGLNFLHIACSRWSLSFAQKIVDRGVDDINSQVKPQSCSQYAGYTPLHFAVQFGNKKIAALLLSNGANMYIQDVRGSTPIHLALQKADRQMIDLLFTYNDQRKENFINDIGLTHFMAACASSASDLVEKFLRERPVPLVQSRVNEFSKHPYAGYSPLHFATQFGNLDSVQLLLDHGASCLAATAEGWTPMTFARCAGRRDILHVLKQHSRREEAEILASAHL